jgi:hypothetical protein
MRDAHALRRYVSLAAGFLLVSRAAKVLACPGCPLGARARCVVFGGGFWSQLGALGVPFLLVVVVATLVAGRYGRWTTKRDDGHEPEAKARP